MTFDTLGDLNWLAIIVAAIAYFALGGIWYSNAVFGKAWQASGGIPAPEGRPSAKYYVGPLLTCFVSSIVTSWLAFSTASNTVGEGIVLGLAVGVGYMLMATILGGLFENKPNPGTWVAIGAGYHIVGLVIAGIIVSIWD